MANIVANQGLATAAERHKADNTQWVVLLLQSTGLEADDTLRDYADVAAMLASTNTEANFTNYARKSSPDTDTTLTVNDTDNRAEVDMADLTWASAGGASNNTIGKLVIAYSTGAGDANLIPITYHDFSVTTDGTDLVAQINDWIRAVSAA